MAFLFLISPDLSRDGDSTGHLLFCLCLGPLLLVDVPLSLLVYSEGWHSGPLSIALEIIQGIRDPVQAPVTKPGTLAQSCNHAEGAPFTYFL